MATGARRGGDTAPGTPGGGKDPPGRGHSGQSPGTAGLGSARYGTARPGRARLMGGAVRAGRLPGTEHGAPGPAQGRRHGSPGRASLHPSSFLPSFPPAMAGCASVGVGQLWERAGRVSWPEGVRVHPRGLPSA